MRILLGDADSVLLDGLACLLGEIDDVEVVGQSMNGRELLELARRLIPDIVLLNVVMDELNGIDFARQLLSQGGPTRILFLTDDPESEPIRAALEAGATGYVSKDADAAELGRAIRSVATGKMFLGSQAAAALAAIPVDRQGRLDHPIFARLTPREREVLKWVSEGHGSKKTNRGGTGYQLEDGRHPP